MPATRPKGSQKTPGSGRKKGSPNLLTKALKDMILGALDDAGGQAYLARQADENPAAFLALLGKVLPVTLKGESDSPIQRAERACSAGRYGERACRSVARNGGGYFGGIARSARRKQ